MSVRRRKIITIAFLLCILAAIIVNVPWPEGSSTFQTEIVAEAGEEVATTLWQVQFSGDDVRLYRLSKDAQDPNSERPQEQPEDDTPETIETKGSAMWRLACFEKADRSREWLKTEIGGIQIPTNTAVYPGYPRPAALSYVDFPSGFYVHREGSGEDLLFFPMALRTRKELTCAILASIGDGRVTLQPRKRYVPIIHKSAEDAFC